MNMSITENGIKGEKLAERLFRRIGLKHFQADWILNNSKGYVIVEVKNKEKFVPPPFYGHGLDIRQINARLKFQKLTNIRCLFLVFDKSDHKVYYRWLDKLDSGKCFESKRWWAEHATIRIYPIKSYKRMKLDTKGFSKLLNYIEKGTFKLIDIKKNNEV